MPGEKRAVDRVNDAVSYTTEAAELAEHLQERVDRDDLDPMFDCLVELIDKGHKESFEAVHDLNTGESTSDRLIEE